MNQKRKTYLIEYRKKNRDKLRAYYEANKAKWRQYHIEKNKEWYLKNKKRHAEKGRIWSSIPENKKKRVGYVQKYVKANKIKVTNYLRRYDKTFNGRFRTTKGNAHDRKIKFNLSLEEFKNIVSKPCYYCGENEKRIGVDRIDNSIGYIKENSAPCCAICNYMKRIMTEKEFLSHIEKIYNFQNNK